MQRRREVIKRSCSPWGEVRCRSILIIGRPTLRARKYIHILMGFCPRRPGCLSRHYWWEGVGRWRYGQKLQPIERGAFFNVSRVCKAVILQEVVNCQCIDIACRVWERRPAVDAGKVDFAWVILDERPQHGVITKLCDQVQGHPSVLCQTHSCTVGWGKVHSFSLVCNSGWECSNGWRAQAIGLCLNTLITNDQKH